MKRILLALFVLLGWVGTTYSQSGSADEPLTVDEFLAMGMPSTAIPNTYVTGYIVGYIPGMKINEAIFGPADSKAQKTNLLLASSGAENDINHCIPIQLSRGQIRDDLNLMDNPENLGRMVTMCGSHEKYYGVPGLKNVASYSFVSNEENVMPLFLNEQFSSIPTTWTNISLAGDKKFVAEKYQDKTFASMSGSTGGGSYDTWLISPGIELVENSTKTLSFSTLVNMYSSKSTEFKAYLMTSNNPADAELIEMPATLATNNQWTYSSEFNLNNYIGVYYVGFHYTAEAEDEYATWCVTDVKLNQVIHRDPIGTGSQENPLTVAQFISKNDITDPIENTWVKGYIVGTSDGMGLPPSFGDKSTIYISDTPNISDLGNCICINLPQGNIKSELNLVDNPNNLYKGITICGSQVAPRIMNNPTEYLLDQGSTGVDSILSGSLSIRVSGNNILAPSDAEIYTIDGMACGAENLPKGMYIVKVGSHSEKVLVK